MKNLIYFISVLILVLTSCNTNKKSNREMIIGEWRLENAEFVNEKIADSSSKAFVNDKEEILRFNVRRRFDSDNRYRELYMGKDEFSGLVEYSLVDKNGDLSPNGHIIKIQAYDNDGSRYMGTSRIGPFEIIKITDYELILKNMHWRYFQEETKEEMTDEIKNIIVQQENILLIFHR